jgi:hypothetical protein
MGARGAVDVPGKTTGPIVRISLILSSVLPWSRNAEPESEPLALSHQPGGVVEAFVDESSIPV